MIDQKIIFSLAIIGHNEKRHLKFLLADVISWVDEVIYVDCESDDQSYEYAENLGCKVFRCPNNTNLNVNKTYAINQCKGEWILYLDPDERLTKDLKIELKRKVFSSTTVDSAFFIKRKNHYFNRWLKYGSQYPDLQLRLFRKDRASFAQKHVHEKLQVSGSIGQLKESMLHFNFLDVSHFLKKFDFYTSVEALYLFDSGVKVNFLNSFGYFFVKPFYRFFKRYILKLGFLDGVPGLFCAFFDALNFIVRYFKLWELRVKKPK